jgi:hypothetical protein
MALVMIRPYRHPKTGMYWVRKVVPAPLRAIVGRSELIERGWARRIVLKRRRKLGPRGALRGHYRRGPPWWRPTERT